MNLALNEASKGSGQSVVLPIVDGEKDQQLIANLMIVNSGNKVSLADGIRVMYNSSYSAAANTDDVEKMNNFAENISSYRNGKTLIVEKRPMITANDTIFLRMTGIGTKNYSMQLGTFDFVQTNLTAYLEDTYLGTKAVIDLSGGITNVDFSATANTASAAADRFRIVFKGNAAPPVSITTIKAYQQSLPNGQAGSNIAVEWKVGNEMNMQKYEVEKSTDGINFAKAATQAATGNIGASVNYAWIDVNPVVGDNYYRVRGVSADGAVKYSDVVKVKMAKIIPAITIYPNPVKGRMIGVQFAGMDKGNYTLRLVSSTGQVLVTKQITHNGGSGTQTLSLGNAAKGSYYLEIVHPDNNKTVKPLIISE